MLQVSTSLPSAPLIAPGMAGSAPGVSGFSLTLAGDGDAPPSPASLVAVPLAAATRQSPAPAGKDLPRVAALASDPLLDLIVTGWSAEPADVVTPQAAADITPAEGMPTAAKPAGSRFAQAGQDGPASEPATPSPAALPTAALTVARHPPRVSVLPENPESIRPEDRVAPSSDGGTPVEDPTRAGVSNQTVAVADVPGSTSSAPRDQPGAPLHDTGADRPDRIVLSEAKPSSPAFANVEPLAGDRAVSPKALLRFGGLPLASARPITSVVVGPRPIDRRLVVSAAPDPARSIAAAAGRVAEGPLQDRPTRLIAPDAPPPLEEVANQPASRSLAPVEPEAAKPLAANDDSDRADRRDRKGYDIAAPATVSLTPTVVPPVTPPPPIASPVLASTSASSIVIEPRPAAPLVASTPLPTVAVPSAPSQSPGNGEAPATPGQLAAVAPDRVAPNRVGDRTADVTPRSALRAAPSRGPEVDQIASRQVRPIVPTAAGATLLQPAKAEARVSPASDGLALKPDPLPAVAAPAAAGAGAPPIAAGQIVNPQPRQADTLPLTVDPNRLGESQPRLVAPAAEALVGAAERSSARAIPASPARAPLDPGAPAPGSPQRPIIASPVLIGVPQPAGQAFADAIAASVPRPKRTGHPVHEAVVEAASLAAASPEPLRDASAVGRDRAAPIDLRQADWPRAMIDRIEALRDAADAGDTRIRLVPDALGKIDIALHRAGDRVDVRFTADVPATRALLAEAQPRLAELAEARGLRLGESSVGSQGSWQGTDQGQRQPTPPVVPAQPRPVATSTGAELPISDQRIA
ncbi:MAG: hypothetical protein B7Y45_07675 [Sphingomonas sp. 28-66-16]|nr:MAG: hypothetical protein B7Y45_07675 [Sphingomonas sp. 28-66-16]